MSSSGLRTISLIAAGIGAVGSVGLMLYVGRDSPQHFLLVLISIWVISPFVLLVLADIISKRRPVIRRATLYYLMLAVSAGTLAVYGYVATWPSKPTPTFVFVSVPPVSWTVIVIVGTMSALMSRRSRHPTSSI